MPCHPLVKQLRFARSEFMRGLDGVPAEDAIRRFEPMNCISWIIGHLADQENRYWVLVAQGKRLAPDLHQLTGYGKPATTPPLDQMWASWREVTAAADEFLDSLTGQDLKRHMDWKEKPLVESIGTMLYRNTYHYWFHLGEAYAIRQMLGHGELPEFVGEMSAAAYRPE